VIWLPLAATLLGAAALSSVAVLVSIRVARRLNSYDFPDEARKTQDRPIPRLGGVAVAVAFSILSIASLWGFGGSGSAALSMSILMPALLAALLGYVDDVKHLLPSVRLIGQAVIGLAAWTLGTRIEVLVGVPLFDLVLTVVVIMVVVNGINLLDNTDGLAGASVLVSALGAGIIAVIFGQELVSVLGFALVGVCLGFLWHNWFPARVYLGDSGAYFLGFLLAVLVIRLRPESLSREAGIAIAILLLALPIVDTFYVIVSRLRQGIHPFTAGRDHLSHQLQGAGLSVPKSVAVLQAFSLLSVVGAVMLGIASV